MVNKNQPPKKLACTASGLSFEEWKHRPVYRAHCRTTHIARQMCGVDVREGQGYASRSGGDQGTGLDTFRALAPYRSAQATRLRAKVAAEVRTQRKEGRLTSL